jgi:hypothetical protein
MMPSNREKFDKDDIRLAKIAQALAHPARIAILRHLVSINTGYFNKLFVYCRQPKIPAG